MIPLVVAGLGAGLGLLSNIFGNSKKKKAAEEAKRRAEEQKKRDLELMDLQFDIAEKEANKNADIQDAQTDMGENTASESANNALDLLRLGQEQDVFNWNLQAAGNDRAEGEALSAMAASGVRSGSSAGEAVDLESAVNAFQLQLEQDAAREQGDIQAAGILNDLAATRFNLQLGRNAANDLRDSFAVGGDQYNLYQKQRANREAGYNAQIEAYQSEIDTLNDPWYNLFSGMSSMFGGAVEGYSTGLSLSQFAADLGGGWDTTGNTGRKYALFGSVG